MQKPKVVYQEAVKVSKAIPLSSVSSMLTKRSSMTTTPSSTVKTVTITDKDIAWLWINLTKAFGYKFLKNFGERDNGIWLEALKDLTREDLDYGFKRVLKIIKPEEREKYEAWPPNVKEFRLYCERRLEDFGLPKAHIAFAEVQNNYYLTQPRWTHPLVKITAKKVQDDQGYVDNGDYALFKKFYDALCQRYMRGEVIKSIE